MSLRGIPWMLVATVWAAACGDEPRIAGPAALFLKVSGDQQTGFAGQPLTLPLRVRLTDAVGVGVAGTTVTWTARTGTLGAGTSVTNGSGDATMTLTLAAQVGADTVIARAAGQSDSLQFLASAVVNVPVLVQVPFPQNYGLHDTFVRDGIAFASAWNEGVYIYDVGNGIRGGTPAAPVLIDTVHTAGGQAHNAWWFHNPVANEQRYLFVGEEGPGAIGSSASGDIHVIDVSDLSNPTEVASYRMANAGAHNFWMDEAAQVLYAAFYNGGVVALDVSGTLAGDLAGREIAVVRPGGAINTYVWGVQLHTNGSIYASDMLSGVWQLQRSGANFSVVSGGNNVPERFGSDLWAHGDYLYTGTWGTRSGNPGNAVKIWHLDGTGAPSLSGTIVTQNIGTVSDVQVSDDGQVLVFSAEGGSGAGLYVYSLADPALPTPLGRSAPMSLHTATVAEINGRRYVFAAKNPNGASMTVFDITDVVP